MVNKAALSVLGVIVLASMGVGVLVGMQIGGEDGGANNVNGAADDGTTAAETEATGTAPAQTTVPEEGVGTIPEADDDDTDEGTQRTTVAVRRFEDRTVEREIKRLVNEWRVEQNLPELRTNGETVSEIEEMSRAHSVAMADAGDVSHTIDGQTSKDRYIAEGFYQQCRFKSNAEEFIVNANRSRLEMVGHTVAGKPYTDGTQRRFNEDETEVAEAIVDDWFGSIYSDRLKYENAKRIAVGVEITRDGTVYATANIC